MLRRTTLVRLRAGMARAALMNASLPAVLGFPFAAAPEPAALITVAPGIAWLRMPLPFALDHINLWLLADGEGWTQVDCGYGNQATRVLWEAHFARSLGGRVLKRVVATHYHPDHLGNAAWLVKHFDCPLFIPQAEFLTAHMVADGHAPYDTESICELFRVHGMTEEHLVPMRRRGNHYRRGVPELPTTFRRLLAGDEVAIGAHRWRCLGGYGHSPEHIALYCETLGACISGDMLLPKISTNVSVWPAEPEGDPLGRFLKSLAVFAALPGDTLILPSHGLPFVGAALRVAQLHAHHAARLAELEAAATAPCTAAELVPVLFRRELDLQQRFFAMGEAIAHLNHLWHAGRLARSADADGTIRFRRAD
jgi:glyoxylase-like metal-dependent hydrolase (beta-lactamase superfamily II)